MNLLRHRVGQPLFVAILAAATALGLSACGSGDGDDGPDVRGSSGGGSSTGGNGSGGLGAGGEGPQTGVDCGETMCLPQAFCDVSGEEGTCQCAPGFEGQRCEDVDECAENPSICGDNASCTNFEGTYGCECASGYVWTGSACEDIDECAQDPCDGSATCSDADGGYSCACDGGSFGNGFACKGTDDCQGKTCSGNGTCVNSPDGFACQCDPGHAGRDDCSSSCGAELSVSAELAGAIRKQLGLPGGAIALSSLTGKTTLRANGAGITSLAGLECWQDLEVLELRDNAGLSGIAPLRDLTKLRSVDLTCTAVPSLDELADHPTLQELVYSALNCSSVLSDLSAVSTLPALRKLVLAGHGLTALTGLTGSRALEVLDVTGNALPDLDELSGLPLLRELLAGNNQLKSVNLEGLKSLEVIDLGGNQLTSLASTASLPRLESISAAFNPLTGVPNWSAASGLRSVRLNNTGIASAEPLAALSQAAEIIVSGNKLESLEPFVGSQFQGSLTVNGNPLPCASQREIITTLRSQGIAVIGSCVGQ